MGIDIQQPQTMVDKMYESSKKPACLMNDNEEETEREREKERERESSKSPLK